MMRDIEDALKDQVASATIEELTNLRGGCYACSGFICHLNDQPCGVMAALFLCYR